MLWAAGGDGAQEITNAFSGADSTRRNAPTGPGTSTEAAVLLASLPWLQCLRQRLLRSRPSCARNRLGTRRRPGRNETAPRIEHDRARVRCQGALEEKSPNRVTIETMREVRRMAPLEHTGVTLGLPD